jgi:hypothetical protein
VHQRRQQAVQQVRVGAIDEKFTGVQCDGATAAGTEGKPRLACGGNGKFAVDGRGVGAGREREGRGRVDQGEVTLPHFQRGVALAQQTAGALFDPAKKQVLPLPE